MKLVRKFVCVNFKQFNYISCCCSLLTVFVAAFRLLPELAWWQGHGCHDKRNAVYQGDGHRCQRSCEGGSCKKPHGIGANSWKGKVCMFACVYLYVFVCVFYHCVYFLDLVTNSWKEKVCMRMYLSTTVIIYYIFGFRYFVFTFVLQSLCAMISILFRTMEHILPLFLILLKDDNADVRLNIISNLYSVSEVWFESD